MLIFQKSYETFPHNAASWYFLFSVLTLGVGPFCSALLADYEVLFTTVHCLLTNLVCNFPMWLWVITLYHSQLRPPQQLSQTVGKDSFGLSVLSGGFHIFLADLHPQRSSRRYKSWKLVIDTSCTITCGPAGALLLKSLFSLVQLRQKSTWHTLLLIIIPRVV